MHSLVPHYINEQAAVIGTGEATWALFWITCLSALATLAAVVVALVGPRLERQAQQRQVEAERARRRDVARAEMQKAIALMNEIHTFFLERVIPVRTDLWMFLNRINVARRLLEYRLTTQLGDETYPPAILQILQSQYEVREACRQALDAMKTSATIATDRDSLIAICDRALVRCKDILPSAP